MLIIYRELLQIFYKYYLIFTKTLWVCNIIITILQVRKLGTQELNNLCKATQNLSSSLGVQI